MVAVALGDIVALGGQGGVKGVKDITRLSRGSEKKFRKTRTSVEKPTPSALWRKQLLSGDLEAVVEFLPTDEGFLFKTLFLFHRCHQEGLFGWWKYYVLFLPSGDCTNLKSPSFSLAPHRVSSQNAKFYHSVQANSVFQVREQSEVPFSTFSGTSLKMI